MALDDDGLFQWPEIIVEAGLVTANPTQLVTSLVLDDATDGKLNTGTLGVGVSWTNITEWVRTFTVNRPATREQGPLWNFQAGTLSMSLDNSDGRFDPDNLSSPYVIDGVSQIDVMVPIRIRANFNNVAYNVFYGYADGWIPDDVTFSGDYATLTLTATDAFKVLAGLILVTIVTEGLGDDTGARVSDILSRVGWYTSAEFSKIDTGNSVLQGTTLGSDALSLIQNAVDSEIGRVYVDESGAVVFRNRHSLLLDETSNSVQAVFGDSAGTSHSAGTELICAVVGRALDDTTLANDIQATRTGGTLQEVQDTASVAKYLFPRTFSKSDLALENDSDALHWAQWVLYISKQGENRFGAVTVDPLADTANLWPQVLGRKFGDRIQAWITPANVTDRVGKDCFITGITHTVDCTQFTWSTQWILQSADKYGSFLVLDNTTLGQLDENALAF